jgi:predicted amidophosphoribosyltransferase
MIVWICEYCQHKNAEDDEKTSDFWCENCGRPADRDAVVRMYWEIKPNEPDMRHIC